MITKVYFSADLGSAYWIEGEELGWCPLPVNGVVDFENDGGIADADIVGDESVFFKGQHMTLNDVYKIVRKELSK